MADPVTPALISGGFSALSGAMQGKGAEDAARITTAGLEDVARVQAGTAQNALQFQKDQAAQDLANANVAALGNYNQYKARETALNTLRKQVGGPAVGVPAFTPYQQVPQSYTGSPIYTAGPGGGSGVPGMGGGGGAPPPENQPTQYHATLSRAMQGPMVTMRAPNGQTQQVPADQVSHYQSKGAQVIYGR